MKRSAVPNTSEVNTMVFHYCRVSTKEQNLDRQVIALSGFKAADMVFADKMSGKNFERTEYQRMKATVSAGDEIVIEELDRLGRNKNDVKEELKWFKEHGVVVRVLDVPTTLMDFHGQDWIQDMVNNILIEVLGAIAEQERNKIHKRMMEGIAAKKARGEWDDYGRPEKKVDAKLFLELREKNKKGEVTVEECCSRLGISRATWYNRLRDVA